MLYLDDVFSSDTEEIHVCVAGRRRKRLYLNHRFQVSTVAHVKSDKYKEILVFSKLRDKYFKDN